MINPTDLFARANTAIEVLADGAERYLALTDPDRSRGGFDARAFVNYLAPGE